MARAGVNLSWGEFEKRFPKQAAEIRERDARKRDPAPAVGRSHFAAKPTQAEWIDGSVVTFPSKTEARVAARLVLEVKAQRVEDQRRGWPATRIFRQVRIPLLSIDPRRGGTPYVLTVDFVIQYGGGSRRYIDAKTKRKSPEWARGRAAAQAELGISIEETDR